MDFLERQELRVSDAEDIEYNVLIMHRYGGPAPRLNGSVALDLHRMDKIIEVSDNYAYAVVEPGVTFTDLYNHCAKNKIRAWPSVPSLGWGSVVGNVSRATLNELYSTN